MTHSKEVLPRSDELSCLPIPNNPSLFLRFCPFVFFIFEAIFLLGLFGQLERWCDGYFHIVAG
jgi:hypothetical protein